MKSRQHALTVEHRGLSRALLILLLCVIWLTCYGCRENKENYFQGYVEGEYLLVSSPIGGKLETLSVSRGMTIAADDLLFSLDNRVESAAVAEAEQGLRRVENKLADISKGLRPSEIQAIDAKRNQAKATYDLARIEYERRERLLKQKVVAKEVLDRTRTELERSEAVVAQLDAELATARLGARPDAVAAAQAEVEANRERLAQARWSLDQKEQRAPDNGFVFDTFYVAGEYVPAAHPVVSILPPGNIKIRFFVPETTLSLLQLGRQVSINLDGKQKQYKAIISYISPQAEYTPPVIYSRESRSHLVYMVEARVSPAEAAELHPGQPVDVHLE